jgi:hypothetical protein
MLQPSLHLRSPNSLPEPYDRHTTEARYRKRGRGFAGDKHGYQKQATGALLAVTAAETDLGSLSAAHPAFMWRAPTRRWRRR